MRARLRVAASFVAVGLGALVVTLLHDPAALIPHAPFGRWLLVRTLVLGSLALLGLLLVLGDDRPLFDEADDSRDPAIFWHVVGLTRFEVQRGCCLASREGGTTCCWTRDAATLRVSCWV